MFDVYITGRTRGEKVGMGLFRVSEPGFPVSSVPSDGSKSKLGRLPTVMK